MIKLYEKDDSCCGCAACANICPKQAITMEENENGFVYPSINQDMCIECSACMKICAYQNNIPNISLKETYVASALDTDSLQSASGGVFASFAKHVIASGGVVYGCAMVNESDTLIPKHIRVVDEENLATLKGSKYVQSSIGEVYKYVQEDLLSNKMVLFSGTPCQIAGLKSFLRKKYDNLFTVDIICHGVPSSKMFSDYLRFLEKKKNLRIIDYKFRDKTYGWKLSGKIVAEDGNGNRREFCFEPDQSSFYQMFLDSYTYRENCYTCPYACDNRPGDITIGDYWCIELVHPEMLVQNGGVYDEQRGVSCLIINNEQGKRLLDDFGSGVERRKSSFENVARYNGQLSHPSILKPERKIVFQRYAKGYAALDRWYQKKQFPIRVKRMIRAAVPRTMKNVIKKLVRHS